MSARPEPVTATSVAEAFERLAAHGYTATFRARADGFGVAGGSCWHPPEAFLIERVFRFEGVSDPDEQTIVFGLRCQRDGTRGTWAPGYGLGMDALDADAALRLGSDPAAV